MEKLESKIASPQITDREKQQLSGEIDKQKEELIRSVRESVWCRIVWFTPARQKSLFLLIAYLSKLMTAVSRIPDLLGFVPEVYVEAVVEIFQALAKLESRFGSLLQLEIFGLQHIFSFFILHFDHPKIINPHICDSILQALGTVFAEKVILSHLGCTDLSLEGILESM